MANWKNINVNLNMVEYHTEKAYLIKCPNNSKYAGFVFWHPAKCVRDGRNSFALSLGYTDEFTFRLKRYGKNNNILEEKEISSQEFEEVFKIVDGNISGKSKPKVIIHNPKEMQPIENPVAREDLIDD